MAKPVDFIHPFPFLPADPWAAYAVLNPPHTKGFILGAGPSAGGLTWMSAAPPSRIWTSPPAGARTLLKKIHRLQRPGKGSHPRFVGWMGFGAGRSFDPALGRARTKPDGLGLPGVWMAEYPAVLSLDGSTGKTTLYYHGQGKDLLRLLARLDEAMARRGRGPAGPAPSLSPAEIRRRFTFPSEGDFACAVSAAREKILHGDIYQANLSLRFETTYKEGPLDLFAALAERNPSPYAALLPAGGGWLVSASPELLVQVEGDRVVTRPIAGTRPRGRSGRGDAALRGNLLLSPKERAEHIMLVDLERNDLGRVCRPGSVRVSERFSVERYSHVMHIVSQVEGLLNPGLDWTDAIGAIFPGGTITGCPKIRAVEIISELEPVGRGPFYGSAGYVAWNGDAKFNILIRTAHLSANGRAAVQAGAGIVADSRPDREYGESLAKAGVLLEALAREGR